MRQAALRVPDHSAAALTCVHRSGSDTQTLPTEEMLEAMNRAALGDDIYREDPTVMRLEERAARMLSRESAFVVVSGTMTNLVSLMVHCRPGDEFFVDAEAQVMRREAGGYAGIARVVATTLEGHRGHPSPASVRAKMHRPDVHRPRARLLWLGTPTTEPAGW